MKLLLQQVAEDIGVANWSLEEDKSVIGLDKFKVIAS